MDEARYEQPEVHDSVFTASGDQRLDLFYVPVEYGGPAPGRGADFHALVWSEKSGSNWNERLRIDRAQFQGTAPNKRWVSKLHGLESGKAIIMVAEGDAPPGSKKINYIYSWREWDLGANKELRTIRICADTFEKF
jgi:hypothetical protein